MKTIAISDITLCREDCVFSFKEKIEIARQLQKLNVDIIELPAIRSVRTDILLIRTISSFVKKSVISVAADFSEESIVQAADALRNTEHPRIRIELPVSPVGMEYTCHKKPEKMLEQIAQAVAKAKELCSDVEFCMLDATRAESDFLDKAVKNAVAAGAARISLCDSAAEMLPNDFAAFVQQIADRTSVPVGVMCNDKNGLACAQAIQAVQAVADCVKTAVGGDAVQLETFADMIKNCGDRYGFRTNIVYTELHRIIKQIIWITDNTQNEKSAVTVSAADENGIHLDANDDSAAVTAASARLGYDLSDEDNARVYEEFCRVAAKKNVGARELEAIIASVALQVPPTYQLQNYVINNGNIISASAQITLTKEDRVMQGVCIGDGPIDAAFLALEQIIGHHYELDDFQIQSVTEGKEAMGAALVKLRSDGKLYSGNGISTDIIGASIRAYLNAVNKIVYQEA